MVRVGLPGSHQNKAVPEEIVYMGKLAPFNQVWVFFSLLIVLQNFYHYLCQISPHTVYDVM